MGQFDDNSNRSAPYSGFARIPTHMMPGRATNVAQENGGKGKQKFSSTLPPSAVKAAAATPAPAPAPAAKQHGDGLAGDTPIGETKRDAAGVIKLDALNPFGFVSLHQIERQSYSAPHIAQQQRATLPPPPLVIDFGNVGGGSVAAFGGGQGWSREGKIGKMAPAYTSAAPKKKKSLPDGRANLGQPVPRVPVQLPVTGNGQGVNRALDPGPIQVAHRASALNQISGYNHRQPFNHGFSRDRGFNRGGDFKRTLAFGNGPWLTPFAAIYQSFPLGGPMTGQVFTTAMFQLEVVQDLDPRTRGIGMSDGVYLVKEVNTGAMYVEKRLSLSRGDRVDIEVAALIELRRHNYNNHINYIFEAFAPPGLGYVSMILEFCDQGTVADLIEEFMDRRDHIPEELILHIFGGLTSALAYAHEGYNTNDQHPTRVRNWNIHCHLDIKPTNVFLTASPRPGKPRVVLADFGCTVTQELIKNGLEDRNLQILSTRGWQAPENAACPENPDGWGPYGRNTDVWQAGALVQVMCRREGLPKQHLVDFGSPLDVRDNSQRVYTLELEGLVGDAMAKDPSMRIRSIELCKRVRRLMTDRGMDYY